MAGPGAGSGGAEVQGPTPVQGGLKEGAVQKPTNDSDALQAVRARLGQTEGGGEPRISQAPLRLDEASVFNGKGNLQGLQPQTGETFDNQGVLGAVSMMGERGRGAGQSGFSTDKFVQQGEAAQRTYAGLVGDQGGEDQEPSDREARIAEQKEKGRAFWEGLPEGTRNWLFDKMIADGVNPVAEVGAANASYSDQLRQVLSRPEAVYKRLQELAAIPPREATKAQEVEAQQILKWMFNKTMDTNPPEGGNPEADWYGDTKFRKIPPEATERFVKAAAEFAKLLNKGQAEAPIPTATPTPTPTSEIRPTTAETPPPTPPAGPTGK